MGLLDTHVQHGTICPRCIERKRSGILIIKCGRYGKFLGCNQYPKCSYTEDIGVNLQSEATKLLKIKRKKTRRSKRKNLRKSIERIIEKKQRAARGQMFSDFKRLITE